MSKQYEKGREWKTDPFMKKIDDVMPNPNDVVKPTKDKLDEALRVIDDVLKQNLDDKKRAHAYVHKGAIYYYKGDLPKARSMWELARVTNLGDEDADANLDKLGI